MTETSRQSSIIKKILLFLLAITIRAILGYIFYGSADVSAFIGIHNHTLSGNLVLHQFCIWCAFPTIPFYLWFCGLLSIKTTLPIAFCFKTIPIFFDALLVVLIYDIINTIKPQYAFGIALLYTLSPISIIVTSIHGQWDSMPLFFLMLALYVREMIVDRTWKYVLYGSLFACSFLLKPIALLFLLFFFKPSAELKKALGQYWKYVIAATSIFFVLLSGCFIFFKHTPNLSFTKLTSSMLAQECLVRLSIVAAILFFLVVYVKPWNLTKDSVKQYLQNQLLAFTGLLGTFIAGFFLLALYNFPVCKVIEAVIKYFNRGITTFGLPFAYPFNQKPIILLLQNRLWLTSLFLIVAWFYYSGYYDINRAIIISFSLIFGFAGTCPQYLVWIIPFLLIAGFYKICALVNVVVSIFYLLYYTHPQGNPALPYQNMMSFGALKEFLWFTPPQDMLCNYIGTLCTITANYIIPFMFFAIACYVFFSAIKTKQYFVQYVSFPTNNLPFFHLWVASHITILIAILMFVIDTTTFTSLFKQKIDSCWNLYAYSIVDGMKVALYQGKSHTNVIFFLICLIMLWSFALIILSFKKQSINQKNI